MLRYKKQTRRDHVVSLLPPISIVTNQPMKVQDRIFSDTPPPMTYTGSFPSKILRHLDRSTFYSTPTKGEEALANKIMHDNIVENSSCSEDTKNNNKVAKYTVRTKNPNSSFDKKQKQIDTRERVVIVDRRCSSAPGSRDEDNSSNKHIQDVGNLTAPSTPRSDMHPRHSNSPTNLKHTPRQLRTMETCIADYQVAGHDENLYLELRGDSIGKLHSFANDMQPSIARPNTRAETPLVDYQSPQEPKQHHDQVKIRSTVRELPLPKQVKQQPQFEVRAVGFSLSHREKREAKKQIKSVEIVGMQTEPMEGVKANSKTVEQTDITIRIPVEHLVSDRQKEDMRTQSLCNNHHFNQANNAKNNTTDQEETKDMINNAMIVKEKTHNATTIEENVDQQADGSGKKRKKKKKKKN